MRLSGLSPALAAMLPTSPSPAQITDEATQETLKGMHLTKYSIRNILGHLIYDIIIEWN